MIKEIYWKIIGLSRTSKVMRILIDWAALYFYKFFWGAKTFKFRGEDYRYFYHLYNRTMASERVVEIPIATRVLSKYANKNVLEVGNVLAHYFPITHTVLDKYEKAPGVVNKDVVTHVFPNKFDLIISVSTLEHVGFSYGEKKNLPKFSKAISSLKKMLKPGGRLFVTLPIGYNPYVTNLILSKKTGFTNTYYLRRISYLNEWKQATYDEIKKTEKYDSHFANSNALFVGEFTK